jgi:hypothetical protein
MAISWHSSFHFLNGVLYFFVLLCLMGITSFGYVNNFIF